MVPLAAGQGTWRQIGTFPADNWYTVPNSVPKRLAATISVKCGSGSLDYCKGVAHHLHMPGLGAPGRYWNMLHL